MKKNDWILAATVLGYSYLFYGQFAGINFLIFTVLLVIALLIKDKTLVKNVAWRFAAFGSILTAACIAYYANNLSIVANIISLSLLSALSCSSKSSVVFSIVYSAYSYLTSSIFMFIDWAERKKQKISESGDKKSRKWILVILPILITFLFFQMYRSSNPLFDEFSQKINFDFISFSWISFTIGGLILLYGFFYHRKLNRLAEIDDNVPSDLAPNYETSTKWFGKEIGISEEIFSGVVLFFMLNALLLIVNALDFNFMFIDGKLPKGIGYSEFVHQGTGMIITSIIVAVIIILYCFRGAINFYEKSKTIKVLAYIWILQNVIMLVSTAMRNNLYITECGLTYKRIGVYFYLALSAIGLMTTFIKILKLKSNNYLFRTNGWIFYSVLVGSCVFSWDTIITSYNINGPKQIEKKYLTRLSDANLAMLYQYKNLTDLKLDDTTDHKSFSGSDYDSGYPSNIVSYNQALSNKLYYFLESQDSLEWKSWSYTRVKVKYDLLQLNNQKMIKSIELQNANLTSIIPLRELDNVITLNLNHNTINTIELQYFTQLKRLELVNNKITNIDSIAKLTKLEYLNLESNPIKNYKPLFSLKSLKELHVPSNISKDDLEELSDNLPNTIIVSTNGVLAEAN